MRRRIITVRSSVLPALDLNSLRSLSTLASIPLGSCGRWRASRSIKRADAVLFAPAAKGLGEPVRIEYEALSFPNVADKFDSVKRGVSEPVGWLPRQSGRVAPAAIFLVC